MIPDLVPLILVLVGLAAVASLLVPVAQRLALPHSVLLALLGIALGALAAWVGAGGLGGPDSTSALVRTLTTVATERVTSEVFLTLFLPVLLFQTGLVMEVRRMMDDIAPILVLAIIAVLVSTFVVGLALAPIAPVGLLACLLLGAIIATTDPVAVVGIFRDVGAPRRLSILVEGESLFNDAAAIALFVVLLGALSYGGGMSVREGTWLFATGFLGGVLFGVVIAYGAAFLMRPLRGHALAETAISVALAYVSYIVADKLLGVSGVVAVVTAALVFGATGRTRVTPESWRSLTALWDHLGYWAATLVFLFASMLVPRFLQDISWTDLGLVAVTVAAAFVARALVLYGLLPLLTVTGLANRVETAYKTVILWGGLRGAVTLALALAVTEDPMLPADIQRFVAVLATGFVLFTLLINGTTLRPMIHFLGLDRLSPLDQALRDKAVSLALDNVGEKLGGIAAGYHLSPSAVEAVNGWYDRRRSTVDAEGQGTALPLSADDRVRLGLVTLAGHEEVLYLRHFGDLTVSRRTLITLLAKAGRLRDAAKTGGSVAYRRAARDSLQFRIEYQAANWVQRRLRIDRWLAFKLADRFESLVISRMVLEELMVFIHIKLRGLLGGPVTADLKSIVQDRIDSCRAALEALTAQYPGYALALEQRFLNAAGLRFEAQEYRTLFEESVINQEVHGDLQTAVTATWRTLGRRPRLDLGLSAEALARRFDLFMDLDSATLNEVVSTLSPVLATPGEVLMVRGERGDFMYFIASGALQIDTGDRQLILGSGQFFGELAILTGRRRSATVTAIGYCQLLRLSGRDFRRFAKRHPELRNRIRVVATDRMTDLFSAAPKTVSGTSPRKAAE